MNKKSYGSKVWVIPDGYIPNPGDTYIKGHEAICFVNTGQNIAQVSITVYFEDKKKNYESKYDKIVSLKYIKGTERI